MPRKRASVSDIVQEEVQKNSSLEGGNVVDITAEKIEDEDTSNPEEPLIQTEEKTTSKETDSVNTELEAKIKQLQQNLEQAQEEIQEQAQKARQNEKKLQQQITELQSTLSEKEALTERLTKELYDAKNAAIKLAEANSQISEEVNSLKDEINTLKQAKQAKPEKQAKETVKSLSYRKSYTRNEKLPIKPYEEPPADNSNQMWLLD